MPSESDSKSDTEIKRITVKLDEFDHKVINMMAKNRNISLSESIRNIVHQWIETNPDILERNYGIDIKEVTEEIVLESTSLSIDKKLKPVEKDIIKELPDFFTLVEDVSIEDLADHFNVSTRVIKKIMFTHSEEIEKVGLKPVLKEGRIYRNMKE